MSKVKRYSSANISDVDRAMKRWLVPGCVYRPRRLLCAVWFACLSTQSLSAEDAQPESDDPPLPELSAGVTNKKNPHSIRVALLDSGVNYLLPSINKRLARSEDGSLVGYDFWDMDARPFDRHPDGRGGIVRHGTRTASLLLREAPFAELVAYRYPRPDMTRMTALVAHAAEHEVRIMGMPLGGNLREDWVAFEAAASAHPEILFIASAGNNGRDIDRLPVYPASLTLTNMLVVTSADDFVRPANGVNWGRTSVDYLLPAERQLVTRFDGTPVKVSGSSYAVPRLAALAARMLHEDESLTASDLIARIRARFANGIWPAKIAQGYIHDPQLDDNAEIRITQSDRWNADTGQDSGSMHLPLDVLVLDTRWSRQQVLQLLDSVQEILSQCQLSIAGASIHTVSAPAYLRDLETGSAKTLLDAVRAKGPQRRLTAVLARDTRMEIPFDAEAFGEGNTRHRPWLTGTVWLTSALKDRAIALAHELYHVLVNSGSHSEQAGNLMLARTTGANTSLSGGQCDSARELSQAGGWVE